MHPAFLSLNNNTLSRLVLLDKIKSIVIIDNNRHKIQKLIDIGLIHYLRLLFEKSWHLDEVITIIYLLTKYDNFSFYIHLLQQIDISLIYQYCVDYQKMYGVSDWKIRKITKCLKIYENN
jgi:hypothetical protein